MPGMNGIQLMKAAHAFSPSTPVVFLSGSVDSSTAVEAMREGATNFVGKTENEFVLLRALDRATTLVRRQYDFLREEEARKHAESASQAKSAFLFRGLLFGGLAGLTQSSWPTRAPPSKNGVNRESGRRHGNSGGTHPSSEWIHGHPISLILIIYLDLLNYVLRLLS
jgi:hypothetical protein